METINYRTTLVLSVSGIRGSPGSTSYFSVTKSTSSSSPSSYSTRCFFSVGSKRVTLPVYQAASISHHTWEGTIGCRNGRALECATCYILRCMPRPFISSEHKGPPAIELDNGVDDERVGDLQTGTSAAGGSLAAAP